MFKGSPSILAPFLSVSRCRRTQDGVDDDKKMTMTMTMTIIIIIITKITLTLNNDDDLFQASSGCRWQGKDGEDTLPTPGRMAAGQNCSGKYR